MSHLFIILVAVVAGYSAWVLADKDARKTAMRSLTHHGIRLGGLVLLALLLVAAAYYFPSSSILLAP